MEKIRRVIICHYNSLNKRFNFKRNTALAFHIPGGGAGHLFAHSNRHNKHKIINIFCLNKTNHYEKRSIER